MYICILINIIWKAGAFLPAATERGRSSELSEFKTTITLNNVDEKIMDYTIARTAMFTIETLQSDGSNKKTFNGNGVNVVIKIKPIQGA